MPGAKDEAKVDIIFSPIDVVNNSMKERGRYLLWAFSCGRVPASEYIPIPNGPLRSAQRTELEDSSKPGSEILGKIYSKRKERTIGRCA